MRNTIAYLAVERMIDSCGPFWAHEHELYSNSIRESLSKYNQRYYKGFKVSNRAMYSIVSNIIRNSVMNNSNSLYLEIYNIKKRFSSSLYGIAHEVMSYGMIDGKLAVRARVMIVGSKTHNICEYTLGSGEGIPDIVFTNHAIDRVFERMRLISRNSNVKKFIEELKCMMVHTVFGVRKIVDDVSHGKTVNWSIVPVIGGHFIAEKVENQLHLITFVDEDLYKGSQIDLINRSEDVYQRYINHIARSHQRKLLAYDQEMISSNFEYYVPCDGKLIRC